MAQTTIIAKNLTKRYEDGDRVTIALDDVSLTAHAGEFIAITGRSGSGKSTLFHQIGLIDMPTHGTIEICGAHPLHLSERKKTTFRLKHIGFIFQDYALIPTLTATENVMLPLLMAGMPRAHAKAQSEKALHSVGLMGKEYNLPSKLSGGQQQRVSIARAIAHKPSIILADEPTANLDHESSLGIIRIFKELKNSGATVVMITHESEYAHMADRIITLSDGKIVY